MALPPKGDPRRPLHLAIRWSRIAGIVLLSMYAGLSLLIYRLNRQKGPGFTPGDVLLIAFYVLPGAAFLVFSIFLQRRKRWAAISALLLASLLFLYLMVAIVWVFMDSLRGTLNFGNKITVAAAIIVCALLAMLGRLAYHSIRSVAVISRPPLDEERGFRPVMPGEMTFPLAQLQQLPPP